MVHLRILPSGDSWGLETPTPLLASILEHSLPIPLGCHGGHCTTCMVQILQGAEHTSPLHPVERYSLTPQEAEAGMRLACKLELVGEGEVVMKVVF